MATKAQEILQDVLNERAMQVAKGRDAAYDDARTDVDWAACLARVVAKDFGSRRTWVKIATIAFAAIEANDRKHQKNLAEQRPPCPGEGWEWDAFALQWVQPGSRGNAIGRAF